MSGAYTPGHAPGVVAFMARRAAATHAAFALPLLRPGMDVVDAGCGPGTITCGLALAVAPGTVTGVDADPGQVAEAARRAADAGVRNARFVAADAYALPFGDGDVDAAFSNALVEHLSRPVDALGELRRVVRPGGWAAVATPDWDAFLLAPEDPEVAAALAAYREIQEANGGDTRAGRRLGEHMAAAGFRDVRLEARFERHDDPGVIARYLADRLEREPDGAGHGAALRRWCAHPRALFAQAWVEAVGTA